ncbi:MAG: hypothetical protein JNM47_02620 [Hyphomonadaceae bacterium]|nr:hypothetical protein [Hyphomonadaceae bacterium]
MEYADFSNWIATVIGAVALAVTLYLTMVASNYNGQLRDQRMAIEALHRKVGGGSEELRGMQEAIRAIGETMEHQLILTDNILAALDASLMSASPEERAHISEVLATGTNSSRAEIARGLVLLDGVSVEDIHQFKTWLGRALGTMEGHIVFEFARKILPLLPDSQSLEATKYLEKMSRRKRFALQS